MSPYTAEDFERIAELTSPNGIEGSYNAIVMAALRIAARVMREGFIEVTVTRRLDDPSSPTDDDLSAAIRRALTEDSSDGN